MNRDYPSVKHMEQDGDTVVIVEGEAYVVKNNDAVIHYTDDALICLTPDTSYPAYVDEDGWIVFEDDDIPEQVLETVTEDNQRYADADIEGYPVTLEPSYTYSDALFTSAWREEKIRPSTPLAKNLQDVLTSVTLTTEISENGDIRVTDISVWPNSSRVTIDID